MLPEIGINPITGGTRSGEQVSWLEGSGTLEPVVE